MIDTRIPEHYEDTHLSPLLETQDPPIRVLLNKRAGMFEIQEWVRNAERWEYVRFWASFTPKGMPRGFKRLPVGPGPIIACLNGAGVDDEDCARTMDVAVYGGTPKQNMESLDKARTAAKKENEDATRAEWGQMRRGVGWHDFHRRAAGKRVTIGMGKGGTPRSSKFCHSVQMAQQQAITDVRKKTGTEE